MEYGWGGFEGVTQAKPWARHGKATSVGSSNTNHASGNIFQSALLVSHVAFYIRGKVGSVRKGSPYALHSQVGDFHDPFFPVSMKKTNAWDDFTLQIFRTGEEVQAALEGKEKGSVSSPT